MKNLYKTKKPHPFWILETVPDSPYARVDRPKTADGKLIDDGDLNAAPDFSIAKLIGRRRQLGDFHQSWGDVLLSDRAVQLFRQFVLPPTKFVPVQLTSGKGEVIGTLNYVVSDCGKDDFGTDDGMESLTGRQKPFPLRKEFEFNGKNLVEYDYLNYGVAILSDRLRRAILDAKMTNVEFYPCDIR